MGALPKQCGHISRGTLQPFAVLTVKSEGEHNYRGYLFDDAIELCPYCLGVLIGELNRDVPFAPHPVAEPGARGCTCFVAPELRDNAPCPLHPSKAAT